MRTWVWAALFSGLMLVAAGCSGSDSGGRVRVTGVVDRKGEPLTNGTITFLPAAGHDGPAANGTIENGKFDIPAAEGPTPGQHQVLINLVASKMTLEFGGKVPARKSPPRMRWEFSADVQKDKSDYDFVLEDE